MESPARQSLSSLMGGLNEAVRRWGDALVILAAAAVYLATLPTGTGFAGDTAKFQFIGYHFGTPHETGYPLYVILNAAWTHIVPVGSLAFRANLLSAVFAVGTLVTLLVTLRHLRVPMPARILAVGVFAVTPTFWLHAVIAEVYTLHILLIALASYFILRWHDERDTRWFALFALTYSVSFGNHGTTLFLLPALVYLVWQTDPRAFIDRRNLLIVGASILLASSLYLYIIFRTMDPGTAYLEMKAGSVSEFLYFAGGGQFTERMFRYAWNWAAFVMIPFFVNLLIREYTVFLPLVVAGFFLIPRPVVGVYFVLGFVSFYSFAAVYEIPDIYVYLIPAYYFFAIFLAFGTGALLRRWAAHRGRIMTVLAAAVVLAAWLSGGEIADQVGDAEREEAVQILSVAGQKSIIATYSYHYAMFLSYYTIGEGREASDSVFVYFVHDNDAHELSIFSFLQPLIRYVREGEPLFLPAERKSVPPGLDVYFLAKEHIMPSSRMRSMAELQPEFFRAGMQKTVYAPTRSMLESSGIRMDSVSSGLYRLVARPAED